MKRQAIFIFMAVILAIIIILYFIRNGSKQVSGFSNEYTLTAYTVGWCPHCTSFKPELAQLGASQNINGKSVAIVNVDPEKEPEKKSASVKGYPTVILATPAGEQEYKGERTASAIISFLKSVVN